MLFLPAAALCCLCSALVAMAEELIQDLTLTRRVGQTVSFSCGTDQCNSVNVYWYQRNERETLTTILKINRINCKIVHRFNHTQIDDFSNVRKKNSCELQLKNVTISHSATYYCSCWKSGYYIFGSGTKLYVKDKQVVKPVVSVYPAASRAHHEGKSSLLCVASNMFPPVVRFSWKRRKENSLTEEQAPAEEEQAPAEEEQLELRESGRTAAIRVIHRDALYTYKYRCYVQHEGGEVKAQTEQ
ncbi:immunoglobulin lambda-1 light chain-like, partial [Micropterus dolomieu]|uniref:immunoglobulin lambda-1 light chain-like n=1 Tax=Micropterus dolomieu TaxID=147949 RepID=UPI001E8D3CDC